MSIQNKNWDIYFSNSLNKNANKCCKLHISSYFVDYPGVEDVTNILSDPNQCPLKMYDNSICPLKI